MRAWEREAPDINTDQLHKSEKNAVGMGLVALNELFGRWGEPAYRSIQVFEGIYKHRWSNWQQFSNLSKELRDKLATELIIEWPLLDCSLLSSDGASKHTVRLIDGKHVECVYIPYDGRATMCISSQVGCAMGCAFCATGSMGIVRNLLAAEIVGQVLAMAKYHRHPKDLPLNIVLMGMGEPLHNLKQVMDAFAILNHPKGMAIPPRRVTISTSGLVPGIIKLGEYSPRPRLALSLNATTDIARTKIMPVNSVWGLDQLSRALKSFPLHADEQITLEYVVIKGISDSMEDARRISDFANQFPSKINLIPYNQLQMSEYLPPTETLLNEMGSYLADRGHVVSIRRSRGQDIGGACGQLVIAK
ncbi:MAG: 23S rRNA (adenine(2503)-C(2))-methyltransferase RlmN [Holophagaceae bacterium]|nr:23S rRNA (adenine(2503)-C(2))-methyltransferase RlmN [Holophagaceae bacterium]